MTESTEELTNQTLFSNEQPILQPDFREVPEPAEELTPEAAKAKQKQKKLMILAGVGGAVLVILLLMLSVLLPKQMRVVSVASPSPVTTAQPLPNKFQATVNELNSDLLNADPTKVDLAIPPVDLSITLDPLPH